MSVQISRYSAQLGALWTWLKSKHPSTDAMGFAPEKDDADVKSLSWLGNPAEIKLLLDTLVAREAATVKQQQVGTAGSSVNMYNASASDTLNLG